ncbi:MAG TPA: hypothetical protein VFU22_16475, partial [Roseiflexaceae bacterium]|nr:hypothetical protein [Roseiflexaceae bacterium]
MEATLDSPPAILDGMDRPFPWDLFQEVVSLRDAMGQLLAESFVRPISTPGAFQPSVDLYETEGEIESPAVRAAAEEVAASVSHLRGVINDIQT